MATSQFSSHQVEILFNSDTNPSPICAGTLISSYLILTVSNCLWRKSKTRLKVRSAQRDATGNFQMRNVEKILSLPALKSQHSENDVALIFLASDFQLGESLKIIDIVKRKSAEPEEFFSLSPTPSSSPCANIRVEKTQQSDCRTENPNPDPNFICVKPSRQSSCPLPLPVPMIGSGLICQVDGFHFLCGALASSENGSNGRKYTDISKYLHWIRLGLSTSSEQNGSHSSFHGVAATIFRGQEVSSSGVSSLIPYQLSLQAQDRGKWNHICGAIIIDEKTALTAAHCFDVKKYKLTDYRVVAGVTHLNSTSTKKQILPLKKILRHPKYLPLNPRFPNWHVLQGNDIAVIHVQGSFVHNENVQNIWISPPNGTNPTDFTSRMSGWGKTWNNSQTPNSLQQVEMRILSDSECKSIWGFLKPFMICGYDNISNTCFGDSGGPLVIQNYQFNQNKTRDLLLGIGSFSPLDCEEADKPNGFTEVSHFLDWINKNRAFKCGATEFQCLNGECIDNCSLCNGIDDCGGGSDEQEKECPTDLEKLRACLRKKQEELNYVTQSLEGLRTRIQTKDATINRLIEQMETNNCTPPTASVSQRMKTHFPYQLSLQELRSGEWEHKCGAVLLDERTALTAANCLLDTPIKWRPTYRLVAGMRRFHNENETTRQILNVTKYVLHYKWRKENFVNGNDIALITVNGSFVLNENVSPVWISSPDDPVLSDFNGTATGWGFTWHYKNAANFVNSSGLSNDLKIMEMPLLSYEDCKGILHFFKDSMICSHNGTVNHCAGDAGGPLVLRNYEFPDGQKRDLLVGISTFGPEQCEDLSKPNGFTKVSSFYEWINTKWKRNTTAPNKFKCFNGQEIDEDLRCDEERDCDDGSDERGCRIIKDEDRPKTRGCGGEIKLMDEHDIIYRVENSEPGKMSHCVWTISNEKNNPIELTLLNITHAQLYSEQNQSQLVALHNFTLENFDYKLISRIGQKLKTLDSYTTLIFRGSAGTQNSGSGSGFHLRVKSFGRNKEENPLKVKRFNLNPTFTLQNHAYPPNNGFYGVNERVFTVLTPSQNGSRIRLNLAFGEMEGGRDWFDVISIGQQPKSLFRFSGARSWTNKTKENAIEGAPDETLLLFMSTGSPAVKRKGIRFTYSEF